MEDKREFTRLLFNITAYMQQTRTIWQTQILDLSLNGALVKKPSDFFPVISGMVYLNFIFPDSHIELEMEMQIIHASDSVIGLKCIYIDMENISHLQKLLLQHQSDPAILDRELQLVLKTQGTWEKEQIKTTQVPLKSNFKD